MWSTKKLSEVAVIYSGNSINATEKQNLYTGIVDGIPYIATKDVSFYGEIDYGNGVRIPPEAAGKFRNASPDTVLVCAEGGSAGRKIAITDREVFFVNKLFALRAMESVLPRYILYFTYSKNFQNQFSDAITGIIGGVSLSKIKNFDISIPPLPEQQRIVAILDKAFAGIASAVDSAEKNLANSQELFTSRLNSIFTLKGERWTDANLSEIVTIKHGFAFKSAFFTNEGDYVLLTPGNFFETGGYRDRGDKQKFYIGDVPRDYVLDEGDLLVAMTEQAAGLLGSPIIVPEGEKFLHNQRLGLITPLAGIPWWNRFFFHAFNTTRFRSTVHSSATGVKVRHTSPNKLGDVTVSYPHLVSEQIRVAKILDELEIECLSLERSYQRKLTALRELKQSILQKAFDGELAGTADKALAEAGL